MVKVTVLPAKLCPDGWEAFTKNSPFVTVVCPAFMAPETRSDIDVLSVSPEFAVAETLITSVEESVPAIQAMTTVPSGAAAPFSVAFPTNTLGGMLEVAAAPVALLGNT